MLALRRPLVAVLVLACLSVMNTPLAAQDPPVVSFSAMSTGGSVLYDITFLNSTTGSVDTWAWTFGDGGTSSEQNPQHTYAGPGNYTVDLVAVGPGGLDSDSLVVNVIAPPLNASFSTNPTPAFLPQPVQFTDESTGLITAWRWMFGDGSTSSEQHPQHIYQTDGNYYASLEIRGPAGTDQAFGWVAVKLPPPIADFTATPALGPGPLTVSFTDTSAFEPSTWLWSFGDGASSTQQNPEHTYLPGLFSKYTVSLFVQNYSGSDSEVKIGFIEVLSAGFNNLGKGLAGAGGTPLLVGTGPLTANSPVSLQLSNALPNTLSFLVFGASIANMPFKGGTLVPSPDIAFQGLSTGPTGEITLSTTWPPGLPAGVQSLFQHWIVDPSGPLGFTASNAVLAITP